jgi:2,3-bisphosphoglycerate-independent phosphoglycerate mutase
MKILMLVLDGGGDLGSKTPYETASKPAIDSLAARGTCGLLDIFSVCHKGTAQSDLGYLNLLGFYSKETYPGRGYLEALGLGMEDICESDICIRGNFATLGANGNILDRRAGRDETGLEELAESIDGLEIDGVHFFVRKSAGHRVVIILRPLDEGVKISTELESNDPEEDDVPVRQFRPKKPEAKFTASVLNKFIFKTNKILSEDGINAERKFPANVILMRGFSRKTEVETFRTRYNMRSCCIGGIPIIKGVATFLGMDIITVPGATGYPNTNLDGKFSRAADALKKYDFVLLHINGTDILSHDAKREEKARFIEKIDRKLGEMLKTLDMKNTVVVVTSDHRTASAPDYKLYRHTCDPVPVMISGGGIKPGLARKFDEKACEKGFSIKGNELIPFVLRQIK